MIRTLLFATLALAGANAFAATCDRACLAATLDEYLTALVAHAPTDAPLGIAFRQTENAVVSLPGRGLWQSTTALGKLQRRYTTTEQAGYFGTIEEVAGPTIVTLRLKVEDRKITETEWVINRKGDPGLGSLGGNQANAAY